MVVLFVPCWRDKYTTVWVEAIGLVIVMLHTLRHAVVLRVLVCACVCVKLPLHTKFPNELLL